MQEGVRDEKVKLVLIDIQEEFRKGYNSIKDIETFHMRECCSFADFANHVPIMHKH